jgi:hypothetical protein
MRRGFAVPDERLWIGVCVGDEAIDSSFEIVDGSKHATLEAPPGELGKESPRRRLAMKQRSA